MFFLPIDRKINDRIPWVIFGLMAVNIVVLVVTYFGFDEKRIEHILALYGANPTKMQHAHTWFTHMFLHAGPLHLVGNMAFLAFFGMNVERRIGAPLTLALYVLSGLGALFLFAAFSRHADIPLVGASGAISGIVGMYLWLFRKRDVDVLWYAVVVAGMVRLPALVISGFWIGLEVLQAVFLSGTVEVAHWAHVGGFLAGFGLLALILKLGYGVHPETYAAVGDGATAPDTFDEINYIEPGWGPGARPDTTMHRRERIHAHFLVSNRWVGMTPAVRREVDGVLPEAGAFATAACVARGLAAVQAEDLRKRLDRAGVAATVYPERFLLATAPMVFVSKVSATPQNVTFTDGLGDLHIVPIASLYLLTAAKSRGAIFIDCFATSPWRTYRITAATQEVARQLPEIAASKAFMQLKEAGTVDAEFESLTELDLYNQWMTQVYAGNRFRKER